MSNEIENTASNGEGNIDLSTDFKQWLQSKGAKPDLVDKMLRNDIDSMDVLAEIDLTEINELAKELGLTYAEKAKFKAIAKSAPTKKLNILVDPDERKAILSMETTLNSFQQSLTEIDDAKTCVEKHVEKCSNLILTMYNDISNALMQRKQSLLTELKNIGKIKSDELEDKHQAIKANSTVISSNIENCYGLVNKKIDLNAIDQRKQHILKIAKTINDMNVIEVNSKLFNINFVCDIDQLFDIIEKAGHFNYQPVPAPMIVGLKCQADKLNIQWKLKDEYDYTKNESSSLRVEWCSAEIKHDENIDDLKINWTGNKMIDLQHIENHKSEINIDLKECGSYCSVRLQCIFNRKESEYSNCKSIAISFKPVAAKFSFTHKSYAMIDENGTRVKAPDKNIWTSVTSSTGWNVGKYIWKILCVERGSDVYGCYDGIGVVTNYEVAMKHKQLNGFETAFYYYSGGACICTTGGRNIKPNIDEWKSGDIMTINLDCDSWKIQFLLNEKNLGIYDLKPNQTYHPALQIRCNKGHLKLLQ